MAYDRPVKVIVIIVAAAALIGASCAESGTRASCPTNGLPSGPLALPDCSLEQFNAMITGLRGTPVVVNFWGSWCGPCRVEAPHLATVSREFEGQVQFLGVDILDNLPSAREFIREYGWQYPSIFDPDEEIHDGLGYFGQPNTVIYGRGGDVEWDHTGAIEADMLRERIRAVL